VKIFALFGRPSFLRAVHGWFVILWIALWIVATWTGWIHSVAYVAHLSQAALVLGTWSAWQPARVEAQQDERLGRRWQQPGDAPRGPVVVLAGRVRATQAASGPPAPNGGRTRFQRRARRPRLSSTPRAIMPTAKTKCSQSSAMFVGTKFAGTLSEMRRPYSHSTA
jgi:hypothetical protein